MKLISALSSKLTLLVSLTLTLSTFQAIAQQEGIYTIPQYKFEDGKTLENVKIAYVTYGKLNDKKSNAVLLTPGTSSGQTRSGHFWTTSRKINKVSL